MWIKDGFGATRQREGFLFFPKKEGLVTRWLEHAQWRERYGPRGWELIEFLDGKCGICGSTLIRGYRGT
jgi:hypothetical protein